MSISAALYTVGLVWKMSKRWRIVCQRLVGIRQELDCEVEEH